MSVPRRTLSESPESTDSVAPGQGHDTTEAIRTAPGWVRAIDRIGALVSGAAAVALVLLTLNVIVDVVGRTLLNKPFPGTLELTTYWWMPALALGAFAYTERMQEHIKVTMLLDALPPGVRRAVEILISLTMTATLAVLTYHTFNLAIESVKEGLISGGAVPLPIWPAHLLAVVALGALTLQGVATTYRHFSGQLPHGVNSPDAVPDGLSGGHAEASATAPPAEPPRRRRVPVSVVVLAGFIVLIVAAMTSILALDLSTQGVGGVVLGLVILLLLVGVPVGIALMSSAVVGLMELGGPLVVASTLEHAAYGATSSWSLSVIPLFVMMGTVLWKSGLTNAAFGAARQWLSWLPGGLAVSTNLAGAGLAAGSGSTIGISYAVGRVAIPEMLKAGYRPSLAAGTVAAAGTLGQVIPPSIMLVIYAGVAAVPIGPQLLAGIVPGMLLALAFAAMIVMRAALRPSVAPRTRLTDATWGSRFRALGSVSPIAAVVLVVLGGIFLGVFTATESAAFGTVMSLVCALAYQIKSHRGWRSALGVLRDSLISTVTATGGIFLLLIGIEVLTRTVALSRVANDLAQLIVDLDLGRVQLLLLLIVLYFILGMFMDTLAMMLLTVPVLIVPLEILDVDLIWFGVFMVIMAEIGLLTPPLGILTYIVHRITDDPAVNLGRPIPLTEVFKGVMWFAFVALAVVVLLIFIPDLVTWLPSVGGASE